MLNPIPEDEQRVIFPIFGTTLLELGNKRNDKGTYKAYFETVGIKHTSVDWNGLDGALKLDLRQPLNLGQFDMVTNIGTTEHVSEQKPVWENIHNACKLGGVISSVTPLEGNWWWHGEWYPRMEFFEQFAKLNGYEIEVLEIGREYPNQNIYARLVKVFDDKQFKMPSADTFFFNKIRPRNG